MPPMKSENDMEAYVGLERCRAIRHALGRWYTRARRDLPWRRTRDPYAVWISEVMLQQTQVKTVIPYYLRFLERFPDIQHLAAADEQSVLKAWEGLGYYSRARNLQRAARIVASSMAGRLPSDRDALKELPGVGDYIAAAVASIAFGRPWAVVDGNVKRVLARLFLVDTPVNLAVGHKQYQALADVLLDRQRPDRHNQAMMELGAVVCLPKSPRCGDCPLRRHCGALSENRQTEFPRKTARTRVPERAWVAGAVIKKGQVLLTQRPAQGLLAGLWEFPGGELLGGDPSEACRQAIQATTDLQVSTPEHVVTVRHAYTHFKLQMDLFVCRWRGGRIRLNGPVAFKWVPPDRIERLPLHKAVHKALGALYAALQSGSPPG